MRSSCIAEDHLFKMKKDSHSDIPISI